MRVATAAVLDKARETREFLEEQQIGKLSLRMRGGDRASGEGRLSGEQIDGAELIVRSFLATDEATHLRGATPFLGEPGVKAPPHFERKAPVKRAKIKIQLVKAGIEKVCAGKPKVDAVAVGHYIGVAPQNAELALDRAISKAGADDGSKLLITALHRRGAISGVLGQNMQLVDTRDPSRVIVLAGMGQPGGFRRAGINRAGPRTGVDARSFGSLQTVLIGSGAGNLPVADACARGFEASANCMMPHPCTSRLSKSSPLSIFPRQIFCSFTVRWSKRRQFLLRTPKCWRSITPNRKSSREYGESRRIGISREGSSRAAEGSRIWSTRLPCGTHPADSSSARSSLNSPLSLRMLRCPSVTQINPQLIDEANNQLPEASDFAVQLNRGNLMGRLLLPQDLREAVMRPCVPLVVTVDATTARIHWEMISLGPAARPAILRRIFFSALDAALPGNCGLASLPCPNRPIISRRALRVLVIADPAGDAPLPGAQEEGESVAAIFEQFGHSAHVEVVPLLPDPVRPLA